MIMPDNGHIELTWSWVTFIPLAVLVLLLVIAVWPIPHRMRIGLALIALLVAWLFTLIWGPVPWATVAQALLAGWWATLVGLVVIFAIGVVSGRK
jgi:H+/gluconate symporter-like permease